MKRNKYHINKNGVTSVCRARTRSCPLGVDELHFDTMQEATEFANRKSEKEYGGTHRSEN